MAENRIVSWFSCGAASAVASKISVEKYGERCIVAYCDTSRAEHPDNKRFFEDVQGWLGVKILKLKSDFENQREVARETRYIVGPKGARCTVEMKKKVRLAFQEPTDTQIFGYTSDEQARVNRFLAANLGIDCEFPLVERSLNKDDVIGIIGKVGIEVPAMYRLGYRNNNCIGCFKGGAGYWNKIREDFPDIFQETALVEREIGACIVRKKNLDGTRDNIFLDELPKDFGHYPSEPNISCSMMCEIAIDQFTQ